MSTTKIVSAQDLLMTRSPESAKNEVEAIASAAVATIIEPGSNNKNISRDHDDDEHHDHDDDQQQRQMGEKHDNGHHDDHVDDDDTTDGAERASIDDGATMEDSSDPAAEETKSSDHQQQQNNSKTGNEKKEPQYSTRGRNASREPDQDLIADRLGVRQPFLTREDIGAAGVGAITSAAIATTGTTPAATTITPTVRAPGVSFLDSLGEEERRTRTRFLPDVEGIHVLYKAEIKQDLQLARTVMTSAGVSSTLTSGRNGTGGSGGSATAGSGGNRRHRQEDDTDMGDEEDAAAPSEDERLSSDSATTNAYVAVDNNATVPSRAFVAPSAEQLSGELDVDGNSTVSPHVMESVTAFDPPRPPESTSAKKKHRMSRWEHRPQNVETDLNIFRKTVQRTRTELQNALDEGERIEAMSAHFRSHFLIQLEALNAEGSLLDEELSKVQLECVKAADLLQSRTRSRGAGKGSYVMKDVLNILKQKGAEIANFPTTDTTVTELDMTPGIGGISARAFTDWDREGGVKAEPPASGWILPGQMIETPYGKGPVVEVFGPTELSIETNHVDGAQPKTGNDMNANHGFGRADAALSAGPNSAAACTTGPNLLGIAATNGANSNSEQFNMFKTKNTHQSNHQRKLSKVKPVSKSQQGLHTGIITGGNSHTTVAASEGGAIPITGALGGLDSSAIDELLVPRVCVALPFGVAFFPLTSCTAKEDVSRYSDVELATRWMKMADTASIVAGCIDLGALANVHDGPTKKAVKTESNEMEVDESEHNDTKAQNLETTESHRLLPFGSGMLPTSAGRAARLHGIPLPALERELDRTMFDHCVVLGQKDNKGVPQKFREWEDVREELNVVRAQVLHRRNQLASQRRLRIQNERAFAATRDKSLRAENLVSEMRADLKSLKDRLDFELTELGIDGDAAAQLLVAHYKEKDDGTGFSTKSSNNSSTNNHSSVSSKRQRREKESNKASPTKSARRRLDGATGSTDDDVEIRPPLTKRGRPAIQ